MTEESVIAPGSVLVREKMEDGRLIQEFREILGDKVTREIYIDSDGNLTVAVLGGD